MGFDAARRSRARTASRPERAARRIGVCVALCLTCGWLTAAPEPAVAAEVIWLSFDGVRHDALAAGGLPALGRMAREGGVAQALVPVFPSSTFVNHVTQATGTHPDRHGIVGNRFFDPELGLFDYGNDARFLDAEPLWAAAERQGVRAATFFWVGSETPWRGVAASDRMTPFDGALGEATKVDRILAWLDRPAHERPRLIMSWWHGADSAGHRHGPGSPESLAQLQTQDLQLGRLLEGLDARDFFAHGTLIVTSDHGMTRADEVVDAGVVLRRAGVRARVIHGTAFAHVHLQHPDQADAALRAFEDVPHVRALPLSAVPSALRYHHPTRLGQILLVAEPPVRLGGGRRRAQEFLRKLTAGGAGGAHGYDPAHHPDMHGVLLALGRGAAPGARWGPVRAIDLAATVARLLAIAPPGSSEGEPLPGLAPPRAAAPVPEAAGIRAAPDAAPAP